MYAYSHVCVCVYGYMYVCMCINMYYVYTRMYVCIYVCMYVYKYVCTPVCLCLSVCLSVCMYVREATGLEFVSCISTVLLIDNRIEVYENKIMLSRAHDSKNNMPTQNRKVALYVALKDSLEGSGQCHLQVGCRFVETLMRF